MIILTSAACGATTAKPRFANEAMFGVGYLTSQKTSDSSNAGAGGDESAGVSASYAHLLSSTTGAMWLEIPLHFVPSTRVVTADQASPSSYSSLYITPGLRVAVEDERGRELYYGLGGGIVRHWESRALLDGRTSPFAVTTTYALRGELGLSLPVFRQLSLRLSIYGFLSGLPTLLRRDSIVAAGADIEPTRGGGHAAIVARF